FHKPDGIYTAMDWEVYPQGLYQILKRVHDDYAVSAMYVTENGAAFDDVVSADGHVHDERRQNFLANHYEVALRAIEDGVPLKGYFTWSLLDNFEWAEGYTKRFGIVYVDYPTQRRIIKDSGYFLARVAALSQQ
ncbi:MAG: glycosyl hydrolase family protein, partial [Chloroflexi bacterium]